MSAADSAKIATYLQQAERQKAVKDWRGASDLINKAALTYWDAREFQKAVNLFHQSLVLNRLVNNQSGIFGIDNNLAFLHADLQEYDSSVYYFQKVLEGRRRQQTSEPIISALINLSVVYNKLKRYEEATRVLEEALEIARSENNLERVRTCYALLAETYEKNGDLKKTQEYFEQYKEVVETLNSLKIKVLSENLEDEHERLRRAEEQKRIAQMEARLQEEALGRAALRLTAQDSAIAALSERYTKNQMALEILRQDSIIKSFEIERLRYEARYRQGRFYFYFTIGIAAIVIALTVIAFLYRLKENKAREARLLQLKNEELATQKAEIVRQAEELRELNTRLKQLFAIIGHDLRSPVISLRGVLDLSLTNTITSEEFNALLPTLHNNVTQLMVTLDNLLLFGKKEDWMQNLSKENLSLFVIIRDVIDLLVIAAQQKQIMLHNRVSSEIRVYFNPISMQTILRNLINNAIKFTPEGGNIFIDSEIQDTECIVSVRDTGIGIPPEKLAIILEEGYTSHGTAGEVGTGLGIRLIKNLCVYNNARLTVESKIGEGSTWRIHIKSCS
ncbi:ATP-binding protein [Rhodoflexus caldus]|uniref:ATP-binding protein n=1 Tax=Rhodoflexus caldus TaxID=2891236 RepID=UPI002029DE14|nr:tetratricopeptide repeat-containing sensor histidine kinase [Rhodoflexus caldus]